MPGSLTQQQVLAYEANGYLAPIPVLGDDEVEPLLSAYHEYERSLARRMKTVPARDQYLFLAETHAYLPWAYELVSQPRALDAIESILGPNLLVWDTRWFTKRPRDSAYVSWHQDGTYWALDPPLACTAWIALSRSNRGNGAMQILPGSHQTGQLPHQDTFAADNVLARGQDISVEVDESKTVTICLMPGEMSIHHIGVVHGSKPNISDEWRIGLAVRYIAPEVRQRGERPIGMLVRGEDRFGHFELLDHPPAETTAAQIEARRPEIIQRMYRNLLPSNSKSSGS